MNRFALALPLALLLAGPASADGRFAAEVGVPNAIHVPGRGIGYVLGAYPPDDQVVGVDGVRGTSLRGGFGPGGFGPGGYGPGGFSPVDGVPFRGGPLASDPGELPDPSGDILGPDPVLSRMSIYRAGPDGDCTWIRVSRPFTGTRWETSCF